MKPVMIPVVVSGRGYGVLKRLAVNVHGNAAICVQPLNSLCM